MLRVSFLSGFVLELAASLSVAIVAVSVGIRLIDGTLPLWLGLFVLVLVPEVYLPLRQVGTQFHAAQEGVQAAGDLFAFIEQSGSADNRTAPQLTVAPPSLTLDRVQALRGGAVVHRPLSFSLTAGSVVWLSGDSGAGKTSLSRALLGFASHRGTFLWAGEPVTGFQLRSMVAWAPQRPDLGAGTVREAITVGHQSVHVEALHESLRLAGALDIDLDTTLGEAGQGVSGGQAQRLSLARAYYRHLTVGSPILLLDEVTSSQDPEHEDLIYAGIAERARDGAAVILISHRTVPSTLVTETVHLVREGVPHVLP